MKDQRGLAGLALLSWAAGAQAHSFGQTFTLPIPFWIYAWASGATLLLTFVLIAIKGQGEAQREPDEQCPFERPVNRMPKWLALPIQALGLYGFFLAIVSGWLGTQTKTNNFSMTWFWIIWILGLVYASGFLGNLYRAFNPFNTFVALLEQCRFPLLVKKHPSVAGSIRFLPALLGLMGLTTLELFGDCRPKDVAYLLGGYGLVYLFCCMQWGRPQVNRYVDFLAVYFKLLGQCARSIRRPTDRGGLLQSAENQIQVLLIVALFATTAYDGLTGTQFWLKTVWPTLARWLAPLLTTDPQAVLANPLQTNYLLGPYFVIAEKAVLWLVPALLYGAYALAVYCSNLASGRKHNLNTLMLAYARCLMPIVLAYSFSHYFTLLLTQGVQIIHLFSDPLGRGWNLIGTRNLWRAPILLDVRLTWNIQIAALLAGHVFSAWLTHEKAFAIYQNRRLANISQIPLLVLMIALTVLGLWILSQPMGMV
ncbi:hypothetical protein [Limnobacter sp.]|uniref:hypothetical protein n=1 Tax=Limnobacter sp. TaxID=2003368 RepID=UPI002582A1B0|nr:hypothetical protein [Limnobacter sp.]